MTSLIKSTSAIITKNIRLLLRAKTSGIIILFGPLILILIAGLAFDNSDPYALHIGVYSAKFNDLSESFVEKLSEKKYGITHFKDEEGCEQSIKTGRVDACVVFPADFAYGTKGKNKLIFTVDYSKVNLVYNIVNLFSKQVSEESSAVRQKLTGVLVDTVELTRTEIGKDKPVLVGLATNAEVVADTAAIVSVSVKALNLTVHNATIPIVNDTLAIAVRDFTNETMYAINASLTSLQAARDETSDNSTRDSLQEAIDELVDARASIENSKEVTLAELNRTSQITTILVTRLEDLMKQMYSAEGNRAELAQELDTVNKRVQDSMILVLKLQESINKMGAQLANVEVMDAKSISEPFESEIRPVTPHKTYLGYLFPFLLIVVVLFSALLLAPTLIHLEKSSPARIRNKLSKANAGAFFFGTFITTFLIISVQILVIIGISLIFFGASVIGAIPQTLLVLAIFSCLFILGGMLIGYVLNTETTALLASVAAIGALLLTSDVIIPLESVSGAFAKILWYNPINICGILLRNVLVYGGSLRPVFGEILALLIGVLVLFVITFGIYFIRGRSIR